MNDKILKLSEKKLSVLSRDAEKIFATLFTMKGLPRQLTNVIAAGEQKKHVGEIAYVAGCATYFLSQCFFALAVKSFRIEGLPEKSILGLLSSIKKF